MASIFRRFIEANRKLSRRFDRLLPDDYWRDGNSDFRNRFALEYVQPGMLVYDIGSGARPFFPVERKKALGIRVVGVDISETELELAPEGSYDAIRVSDIAQFAGAEEADLAICQSVLEHVRDNRGALRSLASIVRPGGTVVMFMPNRYAVFALLNRLLPEAVKRRLLFSIYPETVDGYGFKAFYDNCTPLRMERIAHEAGLLPHDRVHYWNSAYFQFFTPLHVAWRVYIVVVRALFGWRAAETFSLAFRRPDLAAANRGSEEAGWLDAAE